MGRGLHMIIYYHCNSDNALLLSFLLTCHPYIPFHFMKLFLYLYILQLLWRISLFRCFQQLVFYGYQGRFLGACTLHLLVTRKGLAQLIAIAYYGVYSCTHSTRAPFLFVYTYLNCCILTYRYSPIYRRLKKPKNSVYISGQNLLK